MEYLLLIHSETNRNAEADIDRDGNVHGEADCHLHAKADHHIRGLADCNQRSDGHLYPHVDRGDRAGAGRFLVRSGQLWRRCQSSDSSRPARRPVDRSRRHQRYAFQLDRARRVECRSRVGTSWRTRT